MPNKLDGTYPHQNGYPIDRYTRKIFYI